MSNTTVDLNEIVGILEAEFADLERFLNGLTQTQAHEQFDHRGWNVRDHLSHITGWEEGFLMLYFDQPVHQTLGIPLDILKDELMDSVNEVIRAHWSGYSTPQVLEKLRSMHAQVIARIALLSTQDLEQPALQFLPNAPEGYAGATALRLIKEYTIDHYPEHLAYMKRIVSRSI